MEELLVAAAETLAIRRDGRRWNGWIAEALVTIEDGRAAGLDVMPRGFEAIVLALRFDGPEVDGWWRWRVVDGLRVRAAGEDRGDEKCG